MEKSRLEQIRELMIKKRKLRLCSLALAGTMLLTGCTGKTDDSKNNENVNSDDVSTTQYVSDFDRWYAETRDVDTLVCISGNKAILYAYDAYAANTYVTSKSYNYRIVLPEGEEASFPAMNSFIFPNHEMAEEFGRNLLSGNGNIICMYDPEHTEANRKVLVA